MSTKTKKNPPQKPKQQKLTKNRKQQRLTKNRKPDTEETEADNASPICPPAVTHHIIYTKHKTTSPEIRSHA